MNFLGLNEFAIIRSESNENGDIVYYLKANKYKPVCPVCGVTLYHVHSTTNREVRDLNSFGHRVGLIIEGHRYKCLNCGKVYSEAYKDIDTKSRLTNRLREQIEKESLKKPFLQIAEEYSISETTVRKVFSTHTELQNTERIYKTPKVLGIDEAHLNKNMRGVFTDIDNGLILEILPKRSKQAVMDYIDRLPNNHQIRVVTMDMYRPYREAVQECLPYAKIVIDKFHVVQMVTKALETVRKNYKITLSKTERNQLTHDRFVLLKNHEDFTPQEFQKMTVWFAKFPLLETAYRLKESFREIYLSDTKEQAISAYNEWKSSINEDMNVFLDVCGTIDRWHTEIFHYFDYSYTNAFTESCNNMIKCIEKAGRGYSFDVLRAKVLYGTSATKKPQYISPRYDDTYSEIECNKIGFVSDFKQPYKPTLKNGFGVSIPQLHEILQSGIF